MRSNRDRLETLMLMLFFLSGASGLIYEIIWVRMLTMFVGGSSFSVSIVLTVFMAGLALGSALAARFVDRIREPRGLILIYGLLELAIGIYGLLFPSIMTCIRPVYAAIYRQLFTQFLTYNVASSLLSILLLLIPTTLMGATLPVLCRYYLRSLRGVGTRTGRLYGINTIGAALGTLLCGFVMIRWLGVRGTLHTAVAINILIGMICIFVASPAKLWHSVIENLRRSSSPVKQTKLQYSNVLLILAVSGFCSMAYEVIWTKLLVLLVGPTTYCLTIVLFTFITGLALGSMLFGWLGDKVRNPFPLLIATQLLAAGTALFASHALGNSQMFFAKLLYDYRSSFVMAETMKVLALFAFMLFPTICLGAVFPIANKIYTKDIESIGSSVGNLYTVNTIGALLGSFCAGFLLVPLLGKMPSISILVGIQVLTCLILVLRKGQHIVFKAPATICGVLLIIACFFFPKWEQSPLARAKYHRFDDVREVFRGKSFWHTLWRGGEELATRTSQSEILYMRDGIDGFVAVGRNVNSLGATNTFLSISGKTDASSRGDLATMTLSGQIPMLFHPSPRKAMLVGLASGITAGEMLHYPLGRIDILEISPEVVEACEYFNEWNNSVLSDPRARIITQDARTHLTFSDETYDVIMSEPSNPWMAGVANLFTKEYFQKVDQHLGPDGVFVQWFHAYQTDWEVFSIFERTLAEVFPNNVLMRSDGKNADYLHICFKNPEAKLDLRIARANMVHAAKSTNMLMADPILLYPLILSDQPHSLFGPGKLHTDNHPHIEYLAPRQLYSGGEDFSHRLHERKRLSGHVGQVLAAFKDINLRIDFAEFMASVNITPFNLVGASGATDSQIQRIRAIQERYCRENMVFDYSQILDLESQLHCAAAQEQMFRKQLARLLKRGVTGAQIASIYFDLGQVYRERGDYRSAASFYEKADSCLQNSPNTLMNLAACYELTGRYAEAIPALNNLLAIGPPSPRLLSRLGANHLRINKPEDALRLTEEALALDPNYVPALVAAGALYGMRAEFDKAVAYSTKAITLRPTSLKAHQNLTSALLSTGKLQMALEAANRGLALDPQSEVLLSAKHQIIARLTEQRSTQR